jgi:hypothetical protein
LKRSGCFREFFPFAGRQFDQLAAQRFELRRPVVVLDVMREMRDGVDQPIGGQISSKKDGETAPPGREISPRG